MRYVLISFVLLLCLSSYATEDVFYEVPLTAFDKLEAQPPVKAKSEFDWWFFGHEGYRPYTILDGTAESYLVLRNGELAQLSSTVPYESFKKNASLLVRAPKDTPVTGRIVLPQSHYGTPGWQRVEINPKESSENAREKFFKARASYYLELQSRGIPGGAWYRHQAEAALAAINKSSPRANELRQRWRRDELQESYSLFTGGRAIAENLQLDRPLLPTEPGEETEAFAGIQGITIREFDWKPLLPLKPPELDPLAAVIPADQHALFFRSFQAMLDATDDADISGTAFLQAFEPRAEDAGTRHRYQSQLCLPVSEISRVLGPQVISSVAFTGSDPYLRAGSDVAVLFEAINGPLLQVFLSGNQAKAIASDTTIKLIKGELRGITYTGAVSPDRTVCSYLAANGNTVIVTNSLFQLDRILATAGGKAPSMASLDEYIFFRQRYTRDKNETAFLMLTDGAIRRWCSPRWRIGNSRRIRAAAMLSAANASAADTLAQGSMQPAPLPDVKGLGTMTLSSSAQSSIYNTLTFMTPIAELPLEKVTEEEKRSYEQWRNRYQSNWRQAFDPIAIRIERTKKELSADITVMPLIAGTDYRWIEEITREAKIPPTSGDRHPESLIHLALGVNPNTQTVQGLAGFLIGAADDDKNPFAWMGQTISVYVDDDPIWDELAKDRYLHERTDKEFPIAIAFEVKNKAAAEAMLTKIAATFAYGNDIAKREKREHNGQSYWRIPNTTANDTTRLYYALTAKQLVITDSETLLKRTLDRHVAVQKTSTEGSWLGDHFAVQIRPRLLQVAELAFRENYLETQKIMSWSNLLILNEWKRRYPDLDPLVVHQRILGTRLICPGGGKYVWNEKARTMESTVYGYPGEPRMPANKNALPPAFQSLRSADFGITFEHQGLRAKIVFTNKE